MRRDVSAVGTVAVLVGFRAWRSWLGGGQRRDPEAGQCFVFVLRDLQWPGSGVFWACSPDGLGHERLSTSSVCTVAASSSGKPCTCPCAVAAAAVSAPHAQPPAAPGSSSSPWSPSGAKCTPGLPRAHAGSHLGVTSCRGGAAHTGGSPPHLEGLLECSGSCSLRPLWPFFLTVGAGSPHPAVLAIMPPSQTTPCPFVASSTVSMPCFLSETSWLYVYVCGPPQINLCVLA